jgi:hypothetical protein
MTRSHSPNHFPGPDMSGSSYASQDNEQQQRLSHSTSPPLPLAYTNNNTFMFRASVVDVRTCRPCPATPLLSSSKIPTMTLLPPPHSKPARVHPIDGDPMLTAAAVQPTAFTMDVANQYSTVYQQQQWAAWHNHWVAVEF